MADKTHQSQETYFLLEGGKPLDVPADVRRSPADIYENAHRYFVIGYNDAILRDPRTGKVLLPTRGIEPEKGKPWFIGGRTEPNETGQQSISRHVRDDTGLDIEPERFTAVSYWDISHDTPESLPSMRHAKNTVYVADLNPEEVDKVDHANSNGGLSDEYSHGQWYDPETESEAFPNPVKAALRDYFTHQVGQKALMSELYDMAEEEHNQRFPDQPLNK